MTELPKISEAEWDVMKVLWQFSPQTAAGIIENLGRNKRWKPKTVKTLISRLVAKKALGFHTENRSYRYYPLVS